MLRTCIFCGKTFEAPRNASCCSRRCWDQAHRQTWICPYNEHLACQYKSCEKCGWNPEVEAHRKKKLLTQRREVTP